MATERIAVELSFLSQSVHYVVGGERDTNFWEDKWLGDKPIYSLFPRLYQLSSLRNHLVALIFFSF